MTRKLPTDKQMADFVQKDIEKSLAVVDTINGKKPLGGSLGKTGKFKGIDTTKEFDKFLEDINYLMKSQTKNNNPLEFSIDRLKVAVSTLRSKK